MEDVISDFQERVREIEEYLKLLQALSYPEARIKSSGKRSRKVIPVALKTMKASCFLMLYNLVESSIRGSMEKLYEKMNSEGKNLLQFDACVKDVWIDQYFRSMDPVSATQSTYRQLIKEMVDRVLMASPVSLDAKSIRISGNLDAREIRKLFGKHNISTVTHYRALGGAELKTIKDQRNSLAHGDISFAACGQQYAVSDIEEVKKQAVVYLKSALRNIQKYIEKSKYAV